MSHDQDLVGERWLLVDIVVDGSSIPDVAAAKADMTFDADGRVYGYAGCNRFFGGYAVEGGRVSFTAMGSTMMYCQDTMEIEYAFLKALSLVILLERSATGLVLRSEDGGTMLILKREGSAD